MGEYLNNAHGLRRFLHFNITVNLIPNETVHQIEVNQLITKWKNTQ